MPDDQWLRASQSIPLNIAEGSGKSTQADRRKFFEIACGSSLECAAIQDVLHAGDGFNVEEEDCAYGINKDLDLDKGAS